MTAGRLIYVRLRNISYKYDENPEGDEKNMDTQTIEKGFERV
jgi:hypothetical protein